MNKRRRKRKIYSWREERGREERMRVNGEERRDTWKTKDKIKGQGDW